MREAGGAGRKPAGASGSAGHGTEPGRRAGGPGAARWPARRNLGDTLRYNCYLPTGNLDSGATIEVLRLFDGLREAGQTLVIVTHDSRIAATADRLISMRDGVFVDETQLTGGSTGSLGALASLEG